VSERSDFSGLEQFDRVDATGEGEKYKRFLDLVERRPDVVVRRQRSYELLDAGPAKTIVDVGCGTGTAVRELATAGARVVGVDVSGEMIRVARERAPGLDFRTADILALPFDDGTIDGYRAERVYQHVSEPERALREASRVLRSGGRIVLVDQDWETYLVDGSDRRVTRAILNRFCDALVNGWIGRQYARLLKEAGFVDVRILPETVVNDDWEFVKHLVEQNAAAAVAQGAISAEEGAAWLDEQRRRAAAGMSFSSMTHFVAAAAKP